MKRMKTGDGIHNKALIETVLIPIDASGDDIAATIRSMVSGIEKAVLGNPKAVQEYLEMKDTKLFSLILTNWAISAIAANELEKRTSQFQTELNQKDNHARYETTEEKLRKLTKKHYEK